MVTSCGPQRLLCAKQCQRHLTSAIGYHLWVSRCMLCLPILEKWLSSLDRIDFTKRFTACVGPDEDATDFELHEEVLCASSPFFRAALSRHGFLECKERVVRLPELDPKVFNLYTQWSYTGKVASLQPRESDRGGTKRRQELARLYVVAQFLGDTRLRNAIVDIWIANDRSTDKGPGVELISFLYENTPQDCPLMRLIKDWHVCHPQGDWLARTHHELPKQFLVDLAVSWAINNRDGKGALNPTRARHCTYHEHDAEDPLCVL